jgi:DNA repair ATPase RecN
MLPLNPNPPNKTMFNTTMTKAEIKMTLAEVNDRISYLDATHSGLALVLDKSKSELSDLESAMHFRASKLMDNDTSGNFATLGRLCKKHHSQFQIVRHLETQWQDAMDDFIKSCKYRDKLTTHMEHMRD